MMREQKIGRAEVQILTDVQQRPALPPDEPPVRQTAQIARVVTAGALNGDAAIIAGLSAAECQRRRCDGIADESEN